MARLAAMKRRCPSSSTSTLPPIFVAFMAATPATTLPPLVYTLRLAPTDLVELGLGGGRFAMDKSTS